MVLDRLKHTVTAVPERNRAVKALLEKTYGKGCVSVRADRGTAYHWIAIEFVKKPEALLGQTYGQTIAAIEAMLDENNIYYSTYADDMGGDHSCISVRYRPTKEIKS